MGSAEGRFAYIQHTEAGRRIKLHKTGSLRMMRMDIMPPGGGGGRSRGDRKENTRALGGLVFAEQED